MQAMSSHVWRSTKLHEIEGVRRHSDSRLMLNDQQQQTPGLEVDDVRQQPTEPHQQQRRKKQHKNKNTTQRQDQQVNGSNRFFSTLSCRGNNNNKMQKQVSKY
ncbi:unnamed protein product [Polarella glacialis]|uniref:Uncharacterized protein n=1 Tax=Polarella glacialis TaxID=89957 RepID=A0A813IKW4_POLGL|nr:unnamed protein product [Polarella glacialis]